MSRSLLLRNTRKTVAVSSSPPRGSRNSGSVWRRAAVPFAVLFVMLSSVLSAQTLVATINQEHDPAKRLELALSMADESFDSARGYYDKGAIEKGDSALESMTSALDLCVKSLELSNKARLYKRAELKVAYLQRRMSGLVGDLSVSERGWAEQTKRKLEEIHDKILTGVMRK